jgi:hypothetical protein
MLTISNRKSRVASTKTLGVFGLPPTTDVMYAPTLDGNTSFAGTNRTLVQILPTSLLSLPSGSILKIRATFEASSAGIWNIQNLYVGHGAGSGDVYDFASTPVQLLFSGSPSVNMSAGVESTSDWATFAYDKTSNLLFAMYCLDTEINVRRKLSETGASIYSIIGDESATVDKSASFASSSDFNLVKQIEIMWE